MHSLAQDEKLEALTEITTDEAKSKEILEAARMSMGQDISAVDLVRMWARFELDTPHGSELWRSISSVAQVNIEQFATRVFELSSYRKKLHQYLIAKMSACAPNLSA